MLTIIYFPYNSEKSAKLKKRQLQLQLTFMYKVVEGRVPAINKEHYLKSQRRKGTVRAKQYTDFVTKNIVDSSVCNNSKCFKPIQARTENFRYLYFVRTVYDWNHRHLDNNTVNSSSIKTFKTAVTRHFTQNHFPLPPPPPPFYLFHL